MLIDTAIPHLISKRLKVLIKMMRTNYVTFADGAFSNETCDIIPKRTKLFKKLLA